jgi:hypothetical protein
MHTFGEKRATVSYDGGKTIDALLVGIVAHGNSSAGSINSAWTLASVAA